MKTILIVGCGYRGKRLAQRLMAEGHNVRGMTRSADRAIGFVTLGIDPVIADVTKPDTLRDIGKGVSAVYHLMGSMNGDDAQLHALHVEGTRNLLDALQGCTLTRYVYESSTAVYGQTAGEWIDEDVPREPTSKMGKLRVQAEDLLMNACKNGGLPLIILRPSSIYRPEGVINKKIREGTYTLTTDPGKMMNHIYINDFVEIMAKALACGRIGEAYNVTDDTPKTFRQYVDQIATLMSVPPPRAEWQPPAGGCGDLIQASNKRCSNEKLKREFNLTLKFPSYREGLKESARQNWRE